MTVYNIRGPNGSGKTTLARFIMSDPETKPVEITPKVRGYLTPDDTAILGGYDNQCGGMDTVKKQVDAREAVMAAACAFPNVLFEGILISTIYAPWLEVSQSVDIMTGEGICWVYLDTPLETCIARILERNGGTPFDIDTLRAKFRSIESTKLKAQAAGERVVTLDHLRAKKQLSQVMRGVL